MSGMIVRALAPTLVLIGIGANQLYLGIFEGLSPWKGGGFGMFSSVDAPQARFVKLFIVTADGKRHAASPPENLRSQVEAFRAWPRFPRLRNLAQQMAAESWVRLDPAKDCPASVAWFAHSHTKVVVAKEARACAGKEALLADAVELEFWQIAFHADINQVHAEKVFSHIVHVGDRAIGY